MSRRIWLKPIPSSMATERDSPAAYLADRPVLSWRKARWLAISGAVLVSLLGAWVATLPIVQRLENVTIDLRFRLRGPRRPPSNIVIVEINESTRRAMKDAEQAFSLREHLPAAIRNLWNAGALVIGLDIWLEDLTAPEVDADLAAVIGDTNVVLAAAVSDGRLLRAAPPFLVQKPGEGVITVYPDSGDFVLRRLPPALFIDTYGGKGDPTELEPMPHFPLMLAWFVTAGAGDTSPIDFRDDTARIGPHRAVGGELVDYLSVFPSGDAGALGWKSIRFEDAADEYRSLHDVDGAVVIVGSTRSIEDVFLTPLSSRQVPGVYYHANVLAQILENRHFDERWSKSWRSGALTILTSLGAGLFAWNPRRWWRHKRSNLLLLAYVLTGVLIFLGGWCYLSYWSFLRASLLPMAGPLIVMSLALTTGLAAQWVHLTAETRRLEERARRIESLFGRSVSSNVLEALKRDPKRVAQTEVREATVLFCDLRGFTAHSAEMSPAHVAEMLNEYYKYITAALFENDGFLDKFVGDEVMGVFSVPFVQDDHAERAVRAAISIKRRLADLNRLRATRDEPPLQCGIGIHSGVCAVGHIGTSERANYTVVGATVNLAARIEQCTKGGEILISEAVRDRIGSDFQVRHWKKLPLRGMTGEHDLYEIAADNE